MTHLHAGRFCLDGMCHKLRQPTVVGMKVPSWDCGKWHHQANHIELDRHTV